MMLLYNFHGKIIDLSTFTEQENFDGSIPVLNDGNYYHTYDDIKSYIDGDEYYKSIEPHFNKITSFLSSPFFKIYDRVDDLEIFKLLFNDVVKNSTFITAYKSATKICDFVLNPSVKSFLKYNREFRISSNKINYKKYLTEDGNYFNFKENYATFRISNSFVTISNEKFVNILYLYKKEKTLFELDIKASDWLWISYLNYITTQNTDLAKRIIKDGVYDQIKIFDNKTHTEGKLSILASMYSLKDLEKLTKIQADIIKAIDIVEFIDYIINNNSIQLSNGFYRTKEYNIAYYGQTATSIFVTRFIFNAVINLIHKYKGEVIFTKHDSIIFECNNNFEFNANELDLDIVGEHINFCGKDIQITEKIEKILYLFLRNNFTINKLN